MRWLLLLLAAVLGSDAAADTAACLSLKTDLDRLACYDKEAGRTPKVTEVPTNGPWQVHSEKSALNDRTEVFMSVYSDASVDCGWNKNAPILLQLRCMDGKTALIINTDCHMTSSQYDDYGDVTYRLDDNKAKMITMDESTDNRSLGLWSGGGSIPVIKQMFGRSKMLVKMTPFGESPFTATFPITGLEEAVKPLRQACGW